MFMRCLSVVMCSDTQPFLLYMGYVSPSQLIQENTSQNLEHVHVCGHGKNTTESKSDGTYKVGWYMCKLQCQLVKMLPHTRTNKQVQHNKVYHMHKLIHVDYD